jgi:hypothetical protein
MSMIRGSDLDDEAIAACVGLPVDEIAKRRLGG